MTAKFLERIRWGSEIANEMDAAREAYDLREAEREQYDIHPTEDFSWSPDPNGVYSPLSDQGKNILDRINRTDTPIPSAIDSLKAAIFTHCREGAEEKLTPHEIQSFMAQAVFELADLFDNVDHMLFNGSPDGRGGVILGGTTIQDKALELRQSSREIFSTKLQRVK